MLGFYRAKKVAIIVVCLLGIAYALPNFFSVLQRPNGYLLPGNSVNLGLDLKGGVFILLDVDTNKVISRRLNDAIAKLNSSDISYDSVALVSKNRIYLKFAPSTIKNKINDKLRKVLSSDYNLKLSDDGVYISLSDIAVKTISANSVDQSIAIIRRRIDSLGTKQPLIQTEGTTRIAIEIPGYNNPQRVVDLIGKTANLSFHVVQSVLRNKPKSVPPGSRVYPSEKTFPNSSEPLYYYVLQTYAPVTGAMLESARASFNSNNQSDVLLNFNSSGSIHFSDLTGNNVGKRIAIVLDNKVIEAPVVNQAISNGNAEISGGFTAQSAHDLAVLLNAGALPAPLKVIQENSVGPGLGQDSIFAGKIASVVALALVMIFMFVTYGVLGLFADLALLFNIVFIFGLLSLFGATMTLPGIAGIVLTMGMAVDANVIVFEGIRGYIRSGMTSIEAINRGYNNAWSTILDANITTFLAAMILFALGIGPIRGFAVTLGVGIITSVFTSVVLTKLFIALMMERKKVKEINL